MYCCHCVDAKPLSGSSSTGSDEDVIRCVCNTYRDEGTMIQCERCEVIDYQPVYSLLLLTYCCCCWLLALFSVACVIVPGWLRTINDDLRGADGLEEGKR